MNLDHITPLVITYNEAPNLGRTLDRLTWATRVVVIDGGSTDGTLEILQQYKQAEVIEHPFVDFASQCNYGLSRVSSPWVLSLDADYELSAPLVEELRRLDPPDQVAGYRVRFVYRVYGRSLRGSLYPPRTVLFRRERASYRLHGHAHRVVLDGEDALLAAVIYHDDRKPLSRWFASQQRYACEEAQYLLACRDRGLGRADRLRLTAWPAPLAVLFYVLFVKGCILDGWPGWFYALQRMIAEALLALAILDARLRTTR